MLVPLSRWQSFLVWCGWTKVSRAFNSPPFWKIASRPARRQSHGRRRNRASRQSFFLKDSLAGLTRRHLPLEQCEPRCLLAADITIGEFYSNGTNWIVDYSITGGPATFGLEFFRSADGVTTEGAAIQTETIVGANGGPHSTLPLTPNYSESQDDYYLIARVVPGDGDSSSIHTKAFFGGVFLMDGIVHVQGTNSANQISVVAPSTLDVNDGVHPLTSLASASITGVHIRSHGGSDSLTLGNGVTQDVWAFGGSGDDTYLIWTSGTGTRLVAEAPGNGMDTLDFHESAVGVSVNLRKTTAQPIGSTSLLLSDSAGIENVIGTGYDDMLIGNGLGNSLSGGAGNDVIYGDDPAVSSTVVGRHLFYNQSGTSGTTVRYDGNNLAINSLDDNAIAIDKAAYLGENPGAATFANVSSYTKGINGIMVDISGAHPSVTAADFIFLVGNNNSPASWTTAYAPSSVSVRAGAGVGGSDRVTIIWSTNAPQKQWLRVIVLDNANTGLAQPDEFFFGNAVGDTGVNDPLAYALVNATDESGPRLNPAFIFQNIPITNIYDFDRSASVNASDENTARANPTNVSNATRFINLTSPPPPPSDNIQGGDGNDTLRASAANTIIAGGTGSDSADFSWVTLGGQGLSGVTEIESLNLSHASLTSVPLIPTSVTTLDLRYNQLDLSDPAELSPLSPNSGLEKLLLHGNISNLPPMGTVPNLQGIAGKKLRVDLAPIGLECAEAELDLGGIVKALHYLPLEIYDYVTNTYSFQLYNGMMKGALGTVDTRAGNDADLANLLIELLNELNVFGLSAQFAQSVWTSSNLTTGMRITTDQAMRWFGVANFSAAYNALLDSGIPFTSLPAQSGFVVSHTWVQFATPGLSPVPLDPSWKLKDASSAVTQAIAQYNTAHTSSYGSIGEIVIAENPTYSFSISPQLSEYYAQAPGQIAFEWFEDRTSEWLAQNMPGFTLADLNYDGPIRQIYRTSAALPATPGSGLLGESGVLLSSATPPTNPSSDSLSHYARFRMYGVNSSHSVVGTPVSFDLAIPVIALSDLTVQWSGNTAQFKIGSGIVEPFTMPAGATKFVLDFGFIAPGANLSNPNLQLIGQKAYEETIGTVMAIGIEANQITDRFISDDQRIVNEDAIPILQNGNNASLFAQQNVANVLLLGVHKFFLETDHGQEALDRIFQTIQGRNQIAAGVAIGDPTGAIVHPELPVPIVPGNMVVDIKQGALRATSITSSASIAERTH